MSNMTSKPHGVYREHAAEGAAASVYVSYGAHGFPITADRYVDEGYMPPFNTLPWKEDYDEREPAGER